MLTRDQQAELRELAERAGRLPYRARKRGNAGWEWCVKGHRDGREELTLIRGIRFDLARYVAAACSALPTLLDQLDAAETQAAGMEERCHAFAFELATCRKALREYREGYVGSDLAATALRGGQTASPPRAADSSTSGSTEDL